jgi:hypothetical protein
MVNMIDNPLKYQTGNSDPEQVGPILTDQGGELDTPILMCWWADYRCPHFGIHDHHYFFCSALDADNIHAEEGKHAYPWRGAGARNHADINANSTCPYLPVKE